MRLFSTTWSCLFLTSETSDDSVTGSPMTRSSAPLRRAVNPGSHSETVTSQSEGSSNDRNLIPETRFKVSRCLYDCLTAHASAAGPRRVRFSMCEDGRWCQPYTNPWPAPCWLHAVVRWRVLRSWPVPIANWRDERICPCRTASDSACRIPRIQSVQCHAYPSAEVRRGLRRRPCPMPFTAARALLRSWDASFFAVTPCMARTLALKY